MLKADFCEYYKKFTLTNIIYLNIMLANYKSLYSFQYEDLRPCLLSGTKILYGTEGLEVDIMLSLLRLRLRIRKANQTRRMVIRKPE